MSLYRCIFLLTISWNLGINSKLIYFSEDYRISAPCQPAYYDIDPFEVWFDKSSFLS